MTRVYFKDDETEKNNISQIPKTLLISEPEQNVPNEPDQ